MNPGRVKSLFEAMGIDVEAHAAANGDASVQAMYERIAASGRTEDQVVGSLFRAYPDQADDFVKALFSNRGITEIGTADETEEQRLDRIAQEIASGNRSVDDVRQSIQGIADRARAGGGGAPDPADPVVSGGVIRPTGPKHGIGILQGGTLTEVTRPGQEPLLIYRYQFPPGSGSFLYVQFDDDDQATQILGENFRNEPRYGFTRISSQAFENGNYENIGNASEFAGMTGGFTNYIDDVLREAASQAGISDPTILGQMMADPDMQRILVTGSLAGWSQERINAEKRRTTFWTDVLYPGIERFYGQTDQPERAWGEYASNVEASLTALGIQRDADGSFRSSIGELLDGGVAAQTFVGMTPTFVRARENSEYFQHLNAWTQRTLGKTIEFGDWFGVMAGEADPDVMLAAERATLSYIADQGGTRLSAGEIERLSTSTDLSDGEAMRIFAEFDESLTALSGRPIQKYGLNRDDLFSLKTGMKPMSGRPLEEIRRKALQAATEEGLMDDKKAALYVGFTEQGTVSRPGLQSARPMGA